MSDTTFAHYARELHFIRELMGEFGARYPGAKARLLMSGTQSSDPHVERVLQAFALLAGRAHQRINDDLPEISTATLNNLYPHYMAPIPSMGIIRFKVEVAGVQLPNGFPIASGSNLRSAPIDGVPCRFRTVYPVTLWPLELFRAKFHPPPYPQHWKVPKNTAAVLRLHFRCLGGVNFSELQLDNYRLHITGDSSLTPYLYQLLFQNSTQVVFRSPETETEPVAVRLSPKQCLSQVGFDASEGLLPYEDWCLNGYRLLTEYFIFPDKFFFFDVGGWKEARRAGIGNQFEIDIFFDRTITALEQSVDVNMFAEGCTPIVNLFEHSLERIPIDSNRTQFHLEPELTNRQAFEIYSVQSAECSDPGNQTKEELLSFSSMCHAQIKRSPALFWDTIRYPTRREGENGTEMLLKVVDLHGEERTPPGKTMQVKALCSNRDLPLSLSQSGGQIHWELEAAAPLSGIQTVRTLTTSLRWSDRPGRQWKLISHLLLNYLSLENSEEALRTFKEILRLYDTSNPELGQHDLGSINRQVIEGIESIQTRRVVGRLPGEGSQFVRGLEISVAFDETKYRTTGTLLFASVLEHVFSMYVSSNSFTQMVAKSTANQNILKKWPPRRGQLALV